MKKTINDKNTSPFKNLKSAKIPQLTHSLNSEYRGKQAIQNKNDKQVKVICPNCQFHFKVQLNLVQAEDLGIGVIKKMEDNLQKLIEKEYSLISSYSRSGTYIQNSPIIKLKTGKQLEELINTKAEGLERLKVLNQIKELQKSKLHQSRETVRFAPSLNNSPVENYIQSPPEASPLQNKQYLRSQQVRQFQMSSERKQKQAQRQQQRSNYKQSQKQLSSLEKQMLRQIVFDYFQMSQALNAIIGWTIANEHYSSLPYFVKILIDNFQQKIDQKT